MTQPDDLSTIDQLVAIVADILDQETDQFGPNTVLRDDHAPDSHDALMIVLGVEEHFEIDIADEEVKDLLGENLTTWAKAIDERRSG